MHQIDMDAKSRSPWLIRCAAMGLGLLISAAALLLSDDLRILYAIGAILLFASAMWITRRKFDWIATILLLAAPVASFSYFGLRELPALWPQLLLWIVAFGVGTILLQTMKRRIAFGAGLVVTLVAGSIWYCYSYLPATLAQALGRSQNASAPPLNLERVAGGSTIESGASGRIFVIDFFATNCGPCIAELPELAAVRGDLKQRSDVQIVLVASDRHGDTPEGFRAFAEKHHLEFPLGFDRGSRTESSFGMQGTPSLVVVDRSGRLRFTHLGYNGAETNFRRDLVKLIEAL